MRKVCSDRNPKSTDYGCYHLSDPFLRLYYRVSGPNCKALGRGLTGRKIETPIKDMRPCISLCVRRLVSGLGMGRNKQRWLAARGIRRMLATSKGSQCPVRCRGSQPAHKAHFSRRGKMDRLADRARCDCMPGRTESANDDCVTVRYTAGGRAIRHTSSNSPRGKRYKVQYASWMPV